MELNWLQHFADSWPFKDSSMIEDVIEARHGNQKRTILTTNLTTAEFQQEYPRLFSRVAAGLFEMLGEDQRR